MAKPNYNTIVKLMHKKKIYNIHEIRYFIKEIIYEFYFGDL